MIQLTAQMRILVAVEPQDFRKGNITRILQPGSSCPGHIVAMPTCSACCAVSCVVVIHLLSPEPPADASGSYLRVVSGTCPVRGTVSQGIVITHGPPRPIDVF